MRKRRNYLFSAIMLTICLSLTACSGGSESSGSKGSDESEGSSDNEENYEETEYSVSESYDLLNDGRGDLIPDERIPVLMGGALLFTNMQNLLTENNADGTYRYEDFTQDGQILIVNAAEPTCFVPEVQDLADYLTACAMSLSDSDTYELLSVEENEEYSEHVSYPVYIVTYTAGQNEDTRKWTVFAMDTDSDTYLYGFCETLDAAEGMDEIYQSIFDQLYLSDEN